MKKVVLISSTGGHWTQLMQVYKELKSKDKKNLQIKLITEKNNTNEENNYDFLIQQDRKQKMFLLIVFINVCLSLVYVLKHRPDYVISTGAGAVLPYLIFSKIFGSQIIFMESFAKVNSPTITGKIVYKFANHFFVQWPEMLEYYPKALFKGSLY